MKKSLSVAFSVLISATLYSAVKESGLKEDPKARMNQLKNEVSANFTQNLLPFWSTRMVDYKNGGFFGRINGDNQVFPKED